jgi:secreted Zn-dependent insulinase-like peptidase
MYLYIANKILKEKYASAVDAGLDFSIYMTGNAIRFRFSGYNEKMELLVNSVLNDFMEINQSFDEGTYNLYKEEFSENQKNILLNGYYMPDLIDALTTTKVTHYYDEYKKLTQMNFEHLEKIAEKCFKKLKIQILIQGNFLKDQALSVTQTFLEKFNAQPVDDVRIF